MRMTRRFILAILFAPALARAQAASKITMTASMSHGDLVLDIGPFDVMAAMHGDHGDDHETAMPEAPPLWVLVPASGWLHGYRVDLVDKAGRPVPQALLHHVNVIATQRRELFSGIMLRVAAAGPETGTVSIPSLIGYEAHAGDTLLVRAMLRAGDKSYEGVHILVRFPFTSTKAFFGDFTISPLYMDVIGFSGHVHRYATLFKFEDRTANKIIWQTRPDTTPDGEPKQIPIKRFLTTLGYGISANHVYRLTVVYDNPTGAPVVDGGMGALGGVFRPSGGVPWPAIDPNDKDYKLDVWAMWRP